VHIAAPGSDIWSTALRSLGYQYRTASGTSMASPFVAGVVSLIAAANPSLSMIQVRALLLSNVQPLGNLQGYVITGALVDANAAVNAARSTEALPRVWGYVRRRTRGLAGVTLNLESRDGANVARTLTTGSDGSYSFSQLPKGQYILRVNRMRPSFKPLRINATSSRVIKRVLTPR
jgi:subtilisin family serine protease